jgi:hypothetical protein
VRIGLGMMTWPLFERLVVNMQVLHGKKLVSKVTLWQ